MNNMSKPLFGQGSIRKIILLFLCVLGAFLNLQGQTTGNNDSLRINELEYLEMPGLNVMLAHDFYPEGHQGGVGVIQNGQRVATNGDIRLEPTPGQWQPVPSVGKRQVDRLHSEISVHMEYPDPEKNRKGFNPVDYPDLNFGYTIRIHPEGKAFRILVDLDQPLPEEWIGRVGFNFELFPGLLYGRTYAMDGATGIFPRQLDGPEYRDAQGEFQNTPLASGHKLVVAPESESQRMTVELVHGSALSLLDGRAHHNNGWFVIRSLIEKGATAHAIEWLVTPHAEPGYISAPVIQVSQVGYHPLQPKVAMIELDTRDSARYPVILQKVNDDGSRTTVLEKQGKEWGKFLRYSYLQFDFSSIQTPGTYEIRYGKIESHPFLVNAQVFQRGVWQPTLEYFLPVQMCHMRINDRYKVWHGLCHMDDARMAPVNYNHFDGYFQGPSTLTKYQPGTTVPGLNQGGWHDAGDYDLRVESQAEEMFTLTMAWEQFHLNYDNTSVDQKNHVVELHRPDGIPDALQQIEHGALSVVNGYHSLGRLYRGIIEPTLRQYVLLGDASVQTDNQFYKETKGKESPAVGLPGSPDDRWVFTEENPGRELEVAACLAAASRALKDYRPALSDDCLKIAEELWNRTKEKNMLQRVRPAVELYITTGKKEYSDFLTSHISLITQNIAQTGWYLVRALPLLKNDSVNYQVREAVETYQKDVARQQRLTPYGVPYEPNIWGAGWNIQHFGMEQYFLHMAYPALVPDTLLLAAMNFILGVHPGSNTASFASGVGVKSLTVAYGANRDEWSYIPGGVGSGTALIRPDFPELLEWPYLWQQTEYVLGGGASNFMFLVLAADHLLGGTSSHSAGALK